MKFTQYIKESTLSQLEKELEKVADGLDIKVTKHFVDRIGDRNIDKGEVIATIKRFIDKYGDILAQDNKTKIAGVLKYLAKTLNIPLSYNNKGTDTPNDDVLSLITVMKKKGFVSNNRTDRLFTV